MLSSLINTVTVRVFECYTSETVKCLFQRLGINFTTLFYLLCVCVETTLKGPRPSVYYSFHFILIWSIIYSSIVRVPSYYFVPTPCFLRPLSHLNIKTRPTLILTPRPGCSDSSTVKSELNYPTSLTRHSYSPSQGSSPWSLTFPGLRPHTRHGGF